MYITVRVPTQGPRLGGSMPREEINSALLVVVAIVTELSKTLSLQVISHGVVDYAV